MKSDIIDILTADVTAEDIIDFDIDVIATDPLLF